MHLHLITGDMLVQLEPPFTVACYFMYKMSSVDTVHSGRTAPLSVPASCGLLRIVSNVLLL